MPGTRVRLFASLLERLRQRDLPSDEAIQAVVDAVTHAMGTEVATLYVLDTSANELVLAATRGLARSGVGFVTLRLGEGISGLAAQLSVPCSASDVRDNPSFKLIPGFDQSRYLSILAVPVTYQDHLVGALNVQSVQVREYGKPEMQDLEVMAAMIAPILWRFWHEGDLALRLRGPKLLTSVDGIVSASLGPAQICEEVAASLSVILPDAQCSVLHLDGGGNQLAAGDQPTAAVLAALTRCVETGAPFESPDGSILALPLRGDALVCGSLAVRPNDGASPPWQLAHIRHYLETLATQVGLALERMAVRSRPDAVVESQGEDSTLYAELVDLVLHDRGLDAVVEQAARACGTEIGIVDVFGITLAGKPPAEAETDIALRAGDQVFGRLLAAASLRQKPGLETVSHVVSLELAKWKARFEVEARMRGDVLDLLLSGSAEEGRELQARASLVGLDLRRSYTPVMFAFAESAQAELTSPLAARSLLRAIQRHCGEPPESVVFARPDGLLVLVSNCEERLLPKIGEVLRELRSLSRVDAIGAGVGSVIRQPADYPASVKKAMLTASLGIKLGVPGPITSDRLGVHGLLLAISDFERLREFVQDHLGPLLTSDEKSGGEMIRTLEAYHAAGEKLGPAAKMLYVHVNTLKYRLSRIEALTGRNLDEPTDRFNMYVALYALRLVDPGHQTLIPNELRSLALAATNNATGENDA